MKQKIKRAAYSYTILMRAIKRVERPSYRRSLILGVVVYSLLLKMICPGWMLHKGLYDLIEFCHTKLWGLIWQHCKAACKSRGTNKMSCILTSVLDWQLICDMTPSILALTTLYLKRSGKGSPCLEAQNRNNTSLLCSSCSCSVCVYLTLYSYI